MKNWIRDTFLDKYSLMLKVFEQKWRTAESTVTKLLEIFNKYNICKHDRILEVGCGNGRVIINLALRGYTNIIGIDICPKFLEDANRKALEYNVSHRVDLIATDARFLANVLHRAKVKAVLFVWTSVIGYHESEVEDSEILKQCKFITSKGSYLIVLEHSNREIVEQLHELIRSYCLISEFGDIVLIEKPRYDKDRKVVENVWLFYRRVGKDLIFLGDVSIKLRLYTPQELIGLAMRVGWKPVEVSCNKYRIDLVFTSE